jgi:hypothetical protein
MLISNFKIQIRVLNSRIQASVQHKAKLHQKNKITIKYVYYYNIKQNYMKHYYIRQQITIKISFEHLCLDTSNETVSNLPLTSPPANKR